MRVQWARGRRLERADEALLDCASGAAGSQHRWAGRQSPDPTAIWPQALTAACMDELKEAARRASRGQLHSSHQRKLHRPELAPILLRVLA